MDSGDTRLAAKSSLPILSSPFLTLPIIDRSLQNPNLPLADRLNLLQAKLQILDESLHTLYKSLHASHALSSGSSGPSGPAESITRRYDDKTLDMDLWTEDEVKGYGKALRDILEVRMEVCRSWWDRQTSFGEVEHSLGLVESSSKAFMKGFKKRLKRRNDLSNENDRECGSQREGVEVQSAGLKDRDKQRSKKSDTSKSRNAEGTSYEQGARDLSAGKSGASGQNDHGEIVNELAGTEREEQDGLGDVVLEIKALRIDGLNLLGDLDEARGRDSRAKRSRDLARQLEGEDGL